METAGAGERSHHWKYLIASDVHKCNVKEGEYFLALSRYLSWINDTNCQAWALELLSMKLNIELLVITFIR